MSALRFGTPRFGFPVRRPALLREPVESFTPEAMECISGTPVRRPEPCEPPSMTAAFSIDRVTRLIAARCATKDASDDAAR